MTWPWPDHDLTAKNDTGQHLQFLRCFFKGGLNCQPLKKFYKFSRNKWIELHVTRRNRRTSAHLNSLQTMTPLVSMTPVTWYMIYDYERPCKGISILIITWKAAINGGIQTKRWRRLEISCVILTQGNWIWYWASKGFTRKRDSPNFTNNQLAISYVSVTL